MADIIGRPENLSRIKECRTYETYEYVDTLLVKKMLQFKLPAAHSVRILAGEAQGLILFVLLRRVAILDHE